jgi:uncharacterized phage protein gp47/JayE
MAGVTNEGFRIKRLRQIIADLETEARNQYGDDISTDVNTVLGRALRVDAPSLSDLWEAAEEVYNSFNPNKASGVSLDALVELSGLTRFEARPTISPVLLVANKDTELPAGSLASSSFTGNIFEIRNPVFFNLNNVVALQVEPVNAVEGNTYTVTYDSSVVAYTALPGDTIQDIARELSLLFDVIPTFEGSVDEDDNKVFYISSEDNFRTHNYQLSANLVAREVTKLGSVQALEAGPEEQPLGTIDTVAEPINGWVSVINPVDAETGAFRETDTELRTRFANSKETRASNTLEAIYSDLLGLLGVEEVTAYENVTDVEDSRGFPPHSVVAVVEGGSSLEIGNVIWRNKPAGVQTFGNTTVTIVDSQGFNQDIQFIRPVEVPVYVNLEITALGNFDSDGSDKIANAIIDFLDSEYGVGDNVIYSRLYTPINSVPNHQIESLEIGTDGVNYSTANIEVPFDGIARSRTTYINITVN